MLAANWFGIVALNVSVLIGAATKTFALRSFAKSFLWKQHACLRRLLPTLLLLLAVNNVARSISYFSQHDLSDILEMFGWPAEIRPSLAE